MSGHPPENGPKEIPTYAYQFPFFTISFSLKTENNWLPCLCSRILSLFSELSSFSLRFPSDLSLCSDACHSLVILLGLPPLICVLLCVSFTPQCNQNPVFFLPSVVISQALLLGLVYFLVMRCPPHSHFSFFCFWSTLCSGTLCAAELVPSVSLQPCSGPGPSG